MTQYELVQARRYLQQDVLALRRVEGISATTVKIVWDVGIFLRNFVLDTYHVNNIDIIAMI